MIIPAGFLSILSVWDFVPSIFQWRKRGLKLDDHLDSHENEYFLICLNYWKIKSTICVLKLSDLKLSKYLSPDYECIVQKSRREFYSMLQLYWVFLYNIYILSSPSISFLTGFIGLFRYMDQ